MKAEWAFRLFDFDNDNLIGKEDIENVLTKIANNASSDDSTKFLTKDDTETVVRNVLDETDVDRSDYINVIEFKQLLSKSDSFADNFRVRL